MTTMGWDGGVDPFQCYQPTQPRSRSDIIVRLRIAPHPVYHADIVEPCDLHACVSVGLSARCYGADVLLPHFRGRDVRLTYDPSHPDARQVFKFPGLGLPFQGAISETPETPSETPETPSRPPSSHPPDVSSPRRGGWAPSDVSSPRRGGCPRGDLYVFVDVGLPSWVSTEAGRRLAASPRTRAVLLAIDALTLGAGTLSSSSSSSQPRVLLRNRLRR
jgi:DnaJ-class molecular chaperone